MVTINQLLKECGTNKKHIVIIGNGVSGITCARDIRKKSNDCITVISSETDYHYSRTALMYIFMGHMRFEDTKPYEDDFWKKNKIQLLNRHVSQINSTEKSLAFSNGETLSFDVLVIASGSTPNKFGWPGQNLKGVQSLYNFQDLVQLTENTKNVKQAVVVGGGLIGVELAEMLLSRNIGVTFLVREKNFWDIVLPKEEAVLIEKHMAAHPINLKLSTELNEILSDNDGRVKAITTKQGEIIPCEFVGLTVGVSPNISFIKDSGIATDRGILVNEYFETNIKDIYAIGDCAQFVKAPEGRRPIEQVWYTGKMHGETLAHTITTTKTAYNPGHWFNSAKFFDIEYQTYGNVPAKMNEPLKSLFWQHPTQNICVRMVYNKHTSEFMGINTFGIRMRHQVFDKWLNQKRRIGEVLENLREANFDPEFYSRYEKEMIKTFNEQL